MVDISTIIAACGGAIASGSFISAIVVHLIKDKVSIRSCDIRHNELLKNALAHIGNSIDDNTKSIKENTRDIKDINKKVDSLSNDINGFLEFNGVGVKKKKKK